LYLIKGAVISPAAMLFITFAGHFISFAGFVIFGAMLISVIFTLGAPGANQPWRFVSWTNLQRLCIGTCQVSYR